MCIMKHRNVHRVQEFPLDTMQTSTKGDNSFPLYYHHQPEMLREINLWECLMDDEKVV